MGTKIRVLSLFDGVACARAAIERAGIQVENYTSIEFDHFARGVASHNYPDILRPCNDVREFVGSTGYDIIIGGSPCQDLSIAKKDRKGLDGEKSGLFFEYVRILKACKPKYFILENVASMHKDAKAQITAILTEIYPDTEVHMINAALVSAQSRKRLFWTNIKGITQPEDKLIFLKDILESGEVDRDKAYCIDASYSKGANWGQYLKNGRRQLVLDRAVKVGQIGNGGQGERIYSPEAKSVTLSALGGGRGAKTGLYMIQRARGSNGGGMTALNGKSPTLTTGKFEHNNMLVKDFGDDVIVRKLTPVECERLQCLPDNYTAVGGGVNISNSQRYKMLGNAFNVDVIAHILSFIDKKYMTKKTRFSARAFLDETFIVVDVVAINYRQGLMWYKRGDGTEHVINLKHVLWIKQGNEGRPQPE